MVKREGWLDLVSRPEGAHNLQPGGDGVQVSGQESPDGVAVVGTIDVAVFQPVDQHDALAGGTKGTDKRWCFLNLSV